MTLLITLSDLEEPPESLPAQFGGKTVADVIQQDEQGPLAPAVLQDMLAQDDSPYINTVPDSIPRRTGLSEAQILSYLDNLVLRIRQDQLTEPFMTRLCRRLWPTAENRAILALNDQLQLEKLGYGRNGTVYKINLAGNDYALKIFRGYLKQHPYYEAAIGGYFTAKQARNVSRLYTANPQAGWMLMEYIGPSSTLSERPGKTLCELGFFIDDPDPSNFINGIRVDYGGSVFPLEEGRRGIRIETGEYVY